MGRRIDTRKRTVSSRHLRWDTFASRINDGPPSLEPIKGEPRTVLFIEPGGHRIGVRFFSKASAPALSPLSEVEVRLVGIGTQTALEVSTANRELYREFYSLCCTLADRVQLDKQSVPIALADTLRSWSGLVRRKSLLSEERQLGLLGELMFLKRIAHSLGWVDSVKAWQGPHSEEHDFTLQRSDVEVKTTRNERRIHQISSLSQLLPKLERPLYLMSIQVSPVGPSRNSQSLSTVIASVMNAISRTSRELADLFQEQLNQVGWSDQDAVHYATHYQCRTPMMAIRADPALPAIVPATLASLGPEGIARIDRLTYSLNLEGLGIPEGTAGFDAVMSSL